VIKIKRGTSLKGYRVSQIKQMIEAYSQFLEFEKEVEKKRKEAPKEIPDYERNLDSWTNEIITRTFQSRDKSYWYAVLDMADMNPYYNPDFLTCTNKEEDVIRLCAVKIRLDALGIGKYAPRDLLKDGYYLHFKLNPHWEEKEKCKNLQ
jgi:hypothetical protein